MSIGWFEQDRDVLAVAGPDAQSYLHSQVSQEVRDLAVSASRWSFLLDPTGKVVALVRITRRTEDEYLVDVDGGFGELVRKRLMRFKIRVKVDIIELGWRCISLRGSGSAALASSGVARDELGHGTVVVPCGWPGVDGVDLLGQDPKAPAGVEEVSLFDVDRIRIEAGWPAMGSELTDATIPGETGLVPLAVSFSKGCYPGQELVERIDSRGGNVARKLRLLHSDGFLSPGVAIERDGSEVGMITSVALTDTGSIGLGYVHRSVEVPSELVAGDLTVSIEALQTA